MYSNLKHILQMIIINKCQLRWHQKWTSFSTKLNHIKHNIDNWIFSIKIPRQFEAILTRHTQIYNSIIMAKEEPPICIVCGVQVTINHILTECRIYPDIRTIFNLPEVLAILLHR